MTRPSLFEFAGGAPAFLALAEAHHARCLADPELNHPFSHPDRHPQHVQRLAAYWGEVMGADDAELPADSAFRAALHAYMRWAVDDVLSYSAEDAVIAADAAMPRWGWDGLRT